jgi:group I intron endonuclease
MFIYLITNSANGKRNVGQTKRKLSDRWREHKSYARNGDQRELYQDMRKFGVASFTFEALDGSATTQAELDRLESFWIAQFDCLNPEKGYNGTKGGQHGAVIVDSERRALTTKNTWNDPEIRARRIAGLKASHAKRTAAEKAQLNKNIAAGNRAQFADPVKKARHDVACANAERFVGWTAEERRAAMTRDVTGAKNPMFGKPGTRGNLGHKHTHNTSMTV